jgi:UDP-N-acetylmuramoyl-tripeptide--D-alanyl-D-alanine ligase
MAVLSLGAVAAATGGIVVSGSPSLEVDRYAIDSRRIRGGEMFFALIGERNNGHRFLEDVFEQGAAAAVISEEPAPPGPAVRVPDTTVALRSLAARVRTDWGGTVIGVTGSCGKTTTKEMLRLVLAGSRRVLATRGNLNNLYGLPLMLLELSDTHEAAVLEMGVSTPGEMAPLAAIARPDVAVLLNVEAVHLVHFSSVEEIAATKGEIIDALGSEGTLVYNADDRRVARLARRHTGDKVSFGVTAGADLRATDIRDDDSDRITARLIHGEERATLELPVGGRHNLMNSLAALAAARTLGVPLDRGVAALAGFRPAPMRGEHLRLAGGVTLWDESYNSNPVAMRAVLVSLATAKNAGRKVVVSADMLELGPAEKKEHEALARPLADAGIDLFLGVGPLSALTAARLRADHGVEALACADVSEASEQLLARLEDGDLVMIKGSRGMGTEVIVEAVKAARGEEPA